MSVRVVADSSLAECQTPDYVRVRTYVAPEDDTVTLATIQRFIEKTDGEDWKVRTLIEEQPMSPDEALGLATRYAERKNIPLVVRDAEQGQSTESGGAAG